MEQNISEYFINETAVFINGISNEMSDYQIVTEWCNSFITQYSEMLSILFFIVIFQLLIYIFFKFVKNEKLKKFFDGFTSIIKDALIIYLGLMVFIINKTISFSHFTIIKFLIFILIVLICITIYRTEYIQLLIKKLKEKDL